MSEKKRIQIYDTTLRDGMQGIEIAYTLQDKLNITTALDNFKVDYIEGGFPLSNEKELEYFKKMKHSPCKHSKIAAFGPTRKPDCDIEKDISMRALLEAETEVVTIVVKSSSAHVTKILGTTLDENIRMITESTAFLKRHQREVIVDLEHFFDGFKLDSAYSLKLLREATSAGADMLVLCDTNGGTLTHEIHNIIRQLPQKELAHLGIHCHNDCEVAVANSLAGIEEGAIQVQGTINGWGERTGNANLVSIIPNLLIKDTRYTARCAENLEQLTLLSRYISEINNIIPDPRQPFVGHSAFSHKAGLHVDVITKDPHLIEQIPPKLVGNERHILLSELAGKSTIIAKLAKYGNYKKNDKIVQRLIELLKKKEALGYEYESAEASFELEVIKELDLYTPIIDLRNYHLELYKSSTDITKTICRIFLYSDNIEVMGAAVGVGPVDTLDKSFRHAVDTLYPEIQNIQLTDYKVRVIDPENSTSAKVRVLITSSSTDKDWCTIGVSENIVDASWQALIDSYEYYLNIIQKK